LGEWRKRGVTFETVSLIGTSSAAAVILSMGDIGHRRAYRSASLLYHDSRHIIEKGENVVFTKEAHEHHAKALQKTNDMMLRTLVHHVYDFDNADGPKARVPIKLKSLHEALQKYEPKLSLSELNVSDLSDEEPTREKYEAVLHELFLHDRPINPEEAVLLGLIDEVL
jgi:ATP-dependent protease ClpP protease subunit